MCGEFSVFTPNPTKNVWIKGEIIQNVPNRNSISNVKKHSMNKKICKFHDNFSIGVVILPNDTDRSD